MAKNFNVEVEFKASGHAELELAINKLVKAQKNLRNGQVAYNKTLTKSNKAISHLEKRNKALTKSIVTTNKALVVNQKTGAFVAKNTRLMTNTFATLRSQLLLLSFGFGIVAATIGKFVKLQAEQELAEKKLSAALGFTSEGLLDYASSLQSVTSFGDEAIISAQALLAAFIKDEDQLKKATTATLDLAAAKGMDLTAAADLVGKSVGSSTNALSRYGIEVVGAVGSTERLESATESIARLYGGQAVAQTLTLSGAMSQLSNTFGDFQEKVGAEFSDDIKTLVVSLNLFFSSIKENEKAIKNFAKTTKFLAMIAISLLLPFGKIVKFGRAIITSFGSMSAKTLTLQAAFKSLKAFISSTGFLTLLARLGFVKFGNDVELSGMKLKNYQTILGKNITGTKLLHDASIMILSDKDSELTVTEKLIKAIEHLLEIRNKAIENGKLVNKDSQQTLKQQDLLRNQSLALSAAKAKEGLVNQMDIANVQAGIAVRDALMTATQGTIVLNTEFLDSLDIKDLQMQNSTQFERDYAAALIDTQKQLLKNKQIQEDRSAQKAVIQGYQQIGQAIKQFAGENKKLAIVGLRIQQIAAVADAYAAANNYIQDQKPIQAAAALAMGLANAATIQDQIKKASSVALARGGSFVTEGEQFIKVGDNAGGRERVSVTPISTPDFGDAVGGQGITVNIQGNVIGTQEFVRDNLLPEIENTIRNNLA